MKALPVSERKARVVARVKMWRIANPEKATALRARERAKNASPRVPGPRAIARALGLLTYYTGNPCSAGHVCSRTVVDKKCVECRAERGRIYYAANRAKLSERSRAWYAANLDKARAASRTKAARDGANAVSRVSRWRAMNPDKARALRSNRKARVRGAEGRHTASDLKTLLDMQKGRCAECKVSVQTRRHVDHIMPIALGGTNDRRNLQILCPTCNLRKNAAHPVEWARRLGRLL